VVVLDREQVVTATVEDGLCNPGLAPPSGYSIRLRLTEPRMGVLLSSSHF